MVKYTKHEIYHLSVHFTDMKCSHTVLQPSSPSIHRTFSSRETEALSPLNTPFLSCLQALTILLSVCDFVPHIGRITQHLFFCDWLVSLSFTPSSFIHVVLWATIPSLLRLNHIPLCACITFCLSIHLLMDIWVASAFCLL